jgi:DNA-binding NarL/FixJ family response regulator
MSVRILIADDDSPIRGLLRRLIEDHVDWEVCGEAVNGLEAVSKTGELTPDLVVLDLAMPQMNGLQAAREIAKTEPKPHMLLLTVQDVSTELANEARKAGFQGAVSKGKGTEVVEGLETLLRQEVFFHPTPNDLFAF